jgi:hypothetical protein
MRRMRIKAADADLMNQNPHIVVSFKEIAIELSIQLRFADLSTKLRFS